MLKSKRLLFISTIVIMLFLIVVYDNRVTAITGKEEKIHSNYIIDTKSMKIDDVYYTVVLNNDYIYVFNDLGNIEKRIDVFESQYFLMDYLKENTDFNPNNISLEIIEDIDGKGYQDLMIIIKEYSFEKIMTISYEDNSIIWEFTPTMKTANICKVNQYCNEPVPITNYEIDDNLYISAGYKLEKIDLKTGEVIKSFTYKNNIWDFAIVSDINNDDVRDIYIAVQTTNVVSIDGKSFKQIDELEVAQKLDEMNKEYVVLLNVWSLEYLPSRDLLIAGSEDGHVYEIDPKKQEIINKTQIFSISKFLYLNVISGISEDHYETYYENDTLYVYFGNYFQKQTYINITKIDSIDEDDLEDYIVEYLPTNEKEKTFITCTSENSCMKEKRLASKELFFVNGSTISYKDGRDEYIYVVDLKTNKQLITSCDAAFNKIVGGLTRCSDIHVYPLDDGYFVRKENDTYYKFGLNGTNDEYEWFTTFISYQESVQVIDHLVIFDSITNAKTGFRIIDKDSKEISSYNVKDKLIIDFKIKGQYLYIIEKDLENNYSYKVFDTITGDLVVDRGLSDALSNFTDVEIILGQEVEIYSSLDDTEISNLLIKINYSNAYQQEGFLYIIYDLKNNMIIDSINLQSEIDLKNQAIYPDINEDGYPEIFYFYFDGENTIFRLYLSGSNNRISEDHVVEKSVDVNLGHYKVKYITDLNNDGHSEVTLDHNIELRDLEYYMVNKAFIVDFTNDSVVTTYSNSYNEYLLYNILSIEDDINNDGLKEIITLDSYRNTGDLNRRPAKLRISNYDQGKLHTMFEYDLFVNINYNKQNAPQNLNIFYDINEDDVKDIVLFSTNYTDVIQIEVFDYESKQLINKSSFDVKTNKKDVVIDEESMFYKSFDLIEYDNHYYFRVNPNGKYNYISAFIDAKTSDIWTFTGKNFKGVFKDKFIFENEKNLTIHLVKPIIHRDIKIKISGIFNNIYHFNVDSYTSINNIEIYYRKMLYTEYQQSNFKVNLPESDYDLFFLMETDEGGIFYYHDIFTIQNNFAQTFFHLGLLLTITSALFYTTNRLLSKYYYRK